MKLNARNVVLLHVIFFLALVALGFASLWVASMLDPHKTGTKMLDHLGAALLVVGTLGIYEKWQTHREVLRVIREIFQLSSSCVEAGITDVYSNPLRFDFEPLITNSESLTLVFNDGQKWLSNHFAYFDKRFARKNTVTEVFLVDPQGDFLAILAKKTGDPENRVRDKIQHTIDNLKTQLSSKGSGAILRIYFLPLFPTYTVFLGDSSANITLYTISPTRHPVPVISVKDNGLKLSMFEFIKSDVQELRRSSKLIFDSQSTDAATP